MGCGAARGIACEEPIYDPTRNTTAVTPSVSILAACTGAEVAASRPDFGIARCCEPTAATKAAPVVARKPPAEDAPEVRAPVAATTDAWMLQVTFPEDSGGGAQASSSSTAIPPLSGSGSAGSGEVGEGRWSKWEQRQSKKNKKGSLYKKKFLSNVPEVDKDVELRFTFTVIGPLSHNIVESCCNSAAALGLQHSNVDNDDEERDAVMRTSSQKSQGLINFLPEPATSTSGSTLTPPSWPTSRPTGLTKERCLCKVPPLIRRDSEEVQEGSNEARLAKLAFKGFGLDEDPPRCASRLEAQETVLVFTLTIDKSPDANVAVHEASFAEQLEAVDQIVKRMRARHRPKLRPVRALLLCQRSKTPPADDSWALKLAEFENRHGYLWKFGPVTPEDGNTVYASFAEMAVARTAQREGKEQDAEEEEDDDDGEADPEEGYSSENPPEVKMNFLTMGSGGGMTPTVSTGSYNSEQSEGWNHPPTFDTERSGSEVSERALDHHNRCAQNGFNSQRSSLRHTSRSGSGATAQSLLNLPNANVVPHSVPSSGPDGSNTGDLPGASQRPNGSVDTAFASSSSRSSSVRQTPPLPFAFDSYDSRYETSTSDLPYVSVGSSASTSGVPGTPAPQSYNTEMSGSSVATTNLHAHATHFGVALNGADAAAREPRNPP